MSDMVDLDRITVGERRREDLGDIDGLAKSIAAYGLLHPVVIDDEFNLIAGERRLRAIRSLGWTEVEVRSLGLLSEAERREIELEENLRRKDLTEYERSKTMVAYVETVAEVLRDEAEQEAASVGFFPDSGKNPKGGRPKKPDAIDRIEERTGVPRATLHEAMQHVAVVEANPERDLSNEPKSVVVAFGAALKKYPDLAKMDGNPRDIIQIADDRKAAEKERKEAEKRDKERLMGIVGDEDGHIARAALRKDVLSGISSTRSKLLTFTPDAIVDVLDESDIRSMRGLIRDGRVWFDDMEKALGNGLRLVENG